MAPKQLGGRRQPWWVRVAVVAAFGFCFGVGLLASGRLPARAAPVAQVTLQLWPSGQGRIDVTQGGQGLDPNPCDFTAVIAKGAAAPCLVTVTVGTPVTLTATPEPNATVPADRVDEVPDFPVAQPAFVRWSRSDCGTATTCTFTPEADSDGDWVTALFTPLQLQVGVFGTGTVTFRRSDGVVVQPACPNGVGYGDRTCHAAVPADLDVEIDVSPNPTGWGPLGCDNGGNPTSPKCTLGMSNLRTLAFVSFNGQTPLDPPFRLTPTVKVKLGGSGQGRVTGSQIDCPGKCQASADFQDRIQLRAEASAGSAFVRWVGVCSTAPTCTFSAGSATQVQALFDTASTTTATTTTTAATTTTATTTTAATTTARTTTVTTTTTTTPRTRLTRISVSGHGGGRVIRLGVLVDRRNRSIARLTKGRTTVVFPSFVVRAGLNTIRLHVPRRTKPGTYRLSIKIGTGGGSRTLRASVRIPR